MKIEKLIDYVELPEVHQQILGDYQGAYSLGVGANGLVLQVQGQTPESTPVYIRLGDEDIPIEVVENWTPPIPL